MFDRFSSAFTRAPRDAGQIRPEVKHFYAEGHASFVRLLAHTWPTLDRLGHSETSVLGPETRTSTVSVCKYFVGQLQSRISDHAPMEELRHAASQAWELKPSKDAPLALRELLRNFATSGDPNQLREAVVVIRNLVDLYLALVVGKHLDSSDLQEPAKLQHAVDSLHDALRAPPRSPIGLPALSRSQNALFPSTQSLPANQSRAKPTPPDKPTTRGMIEYVERMVDPLRTTAPRRRPAPEVPTTSTAAQLLNAEARRPFSLPEAPRNTTLTF
jgi:hypothetical protein